MHGLHHNNGTLTYYSDSRIPVAEALSHIAIYDVHLARLDCYAITTMLTLFKSLVLSRLDYGSQLWSPHLVKHIDPLEKNQRSFTKHISGIQSLEYSDQLVYLKLHSLRECYCIIDVWKIIEGLVPNFSNPIVCSYSDRRGRSCMVSHAHIGRLGTLSFNSGYAEDLYADLQSSRTIRVGQPQ